MYAQCRRSKLLTISDGLSLWIELSYFVHYFAAKAYFYRSEYSIHPKSANRTRSKQNRTHIHTVARRKTIPKGNKDAISLARMNRRSDDGSTYDFAKLQLHDFSAFSVHVDILLFLFFAPVVVCYFKMFYYDISCSEWEYQWAIFSCIPIQYYALIRCFVLFGLRNGLYVYCEKRPKYINYDAVNRMKDFGHIEK